MLRGFAKAVKYLFIAFFVYLLSLFFREERLPRDWVDAICDRYSTTNIVLRCEGASFGLWHGIRLKKPIVYDLSKKDSLEPLVKADSIAVNHLARKVWIDGLSYPRLPDSYYMPGYSEVPDPGIIFVLPRLPTFTLILEQPYILGLEPTRVMGQVEMEPQLCRVRDVRINWDDKEYPTALDGDVIVDLTARVIRGEVKGYATQHQIRPFVERLDITSALPYMDAFTEIIEPIPSHGVFTVDLRKGDFGMNLRLRPTMGRYNGVAMDRADGTINVLTQIRGTNCNVYLNVALPEAIDLKGRKMNGRVKLEMVDNLIRLGFDAKSAFTFKDILAISDFIDPELVSDVKCTTAPTITCVGHTGISAADKAYNDLGGSASLAAGSLFDFQFRDLTMNYRLKEDRLSFTEIAARGKDESHITGESTLYLEDFDADKAHFEMSAHYRDGTLDELADFLKFEVADRTGRIDADFHFEGPLNTNVLEKLNGRGNVKIKKGHLAQLRIFAGLTKELAAHVPGVDYLTNLSDASGDFAVQNGILTTTNVVISGGLVTVTARGKYDIVKDDLDFAVQARLLQNKSVVSTIVSPVTWALTKMLLEFHVKGSTKDPKWEYISPMDKLGGLFGDKKQPPAKPVEPRKEAAK